MEGVSFQKGIWTGILGYETSAHQTASRNEGYGQGLVVRLCWLVLTTVSRNLGFVLLKSPRELILVFSLFWWGFFPWKKKKKKKGNWNLFAKSLYAKLQPGTDLPGHRKAAMCAPDNENINLHDRPFHRGGRAMHSECAIAAAAAALEGVHCLE